MPLRRIAIGVIIAVIVAPVLIPCLYDLAAPGGATPFRDVSRSLSLACNRTALIAGVWLVALPPGTALAVALARTDLAGRSWLLRGFAVALFVPLPVVATAWQETVGRGGPWATGLLPVVLVHAVAGLPWVVWIVA